MNTKIIKIFIIVFLIIMILSLGSTSSKKPDDVDNNLNQNDTRSLHYPTFSEIKDRLDKIHDDHSNITKLFSLGMTDVMSRDIWCLEISDNPGVDEGEPGILFTGLIHANEWPTVLICLSIAENLTSKYNSDSNIKYLLNNRRLWIVPCLNPDGYYWSHDYSPQHILWRKNMRDNDNNGYFNKDYDGVDLNRNFEGSCNGNIWGAWGSIVSTSVSHQPGENNYCGPSPGSEKETQAIASLFTENDICASLNWHTCGEFVCWPWAYTTGSTPDNSYLKSIGKNIAERIEKLSYDSGSYDAKQSSEETKVTGNVNDWSYGYGHYIKGQPIFSYVIEASPCPWVIIPDLIDLEIICAENYKGALYLLWEAEGINNISTRVIPPVIDDMTYDSDGDYRISWQEQNPVENDHKGQFWVETPDDIEDDKKIWMYYGNPDAGSMSNGEDTWLWYQEWTTDHRDKYDSTTQSPPDGYGTTYSFCKGQNISEYISDEADNGLRYLFKMNIDSWDYDQFGCGNRYGLQGKNDVWDDHSVNYTGLYFVSDNSGGGSSTNLAIRLLASNATSQVYSEYGHPSFTDDEYYLWEVAYVNGSKLAGSMRTLNRSMVKWSEVITSNVSTNVRLSLVSKLFRTWDNLPPGYEWVYYSDTDELFCGGHRSSVSHQYNRIKWEAIGKYNSSEPSWMSFSDGEKLSDSSENWWNTNWSYRRLINISDAINGYQMMIDIGYNTSGNVTCDGFCQLGFDDIRFIDYDNNTELDYWREECFTPVFYQLDELSNNTILTDDAENGSVFWVLDGFSLIDTQGHSGSHCFKSRWEYSDVSSMTTKDPILIFDEMNLSFWWWGGMEENYDYTFVEVSKNGRYYEIIDKITGDSGGWIYKEYPLDDFVNESIFIRFRHATDSYINSYGFYVDDIMPLSIFGNISTISSSIIDNHYSIEGRAHGKYFYRVRGYNLERGWGDFSTLKKIIVNVQPNMPCDPNLSNNTTVEVYADLKWNCIDPDGDPLTYDVYLGTSSPPPLVSSGQSDKTYNPETLESGKTYYWKIVAYDNYKASNTSPIWQFKTDGLPPEWKNQSQNKTYILPGESISLYSKVKDNIALNFAWLATNEIGNWYSDCWMYRKEIVINHKKVEGHLTNFPVLFYNVSSVFVNHSQSDGDDFLFTDKDGIKLNHEVERYDALTGELVAWVNVTSLNSTEDTFLYLYYGNPVCSNQQNVEGTWDSDFIMVHHLEETTGIATDSISNYNLTIEGIESQGIVAGVAGNCYDFERDPEPVGDMLVNSKGWTYHNNSNYTLEAWGKMESMVDYEDPYSAAGPVLTVYEDGHTWSGGALITDPGTCSPGIWYHFIERYNVSGKETILNKNSLGIGNKSDLMFGLKGNCEIIFGSDGGYNYDWDGLLDELRCSRIVRPNSWINTTYNTIRSPETFMSVGTEELAEKFGEQQYGSPIKMQENDEWQQTSYIWKNELIPAGTNVSWRIYYIDTSGNINCTDIMIFLIDSGVYNITYLSNDWNFVSIPFNQSVNKSDLIIMYNGSEYTWQEAVDNNIILGFIYNWNRNNQNYELVDILNSGNGYWMYTYYNCELWAEIGKNIAEDDLISDLYNEWNLIGLPDDVPVHKENLTVYYNGIEYTWQEAVDNSFVLNFIYLWNETNQNYEITDILIPGKACWMYAYVDCRLLKPE